MERTSDSWVELVEVPWIGSAGNVERTSEQPSNTNRRQSGINPLDLLTSQENPERGQEGYSRRERVKKRKRGDGKARRSRK